MNQKKNQNLSFQNLFQQFDEKGQLLLADTTISFGELPWCNHPTFEGVALKHLITAAQTNGQFSYHLVRIAPGKQIGSHVHKDQLETHEVIAGDGFCINNGTRMEYAPGTTTILPLGTPHEVTAGADGLYLFAKFIPALC